MATVCLATSGLAGCATTQAATRQPTRLATAAQVAPTPAPTPGPQHVVAPHREWADAVVYFAIVDRFADGDPSNNTGVDRKAKGAFHGGDLAGLRERLDDLAELGITALWITPVVDNIDGFVTGAGFPDWAYHGYWAEDFTRLDPRFGTEAQLAALVTDARARGIAVLLDVVYNHVGYESQFERDPVTRSWLRSASPGGCGQDDITSCVAGLPDLRTENPEVADYLFDAHLGLAKRVGLAGFRLDTVKHVTHEFWQAHRARATAELGADFFLLGEVWGGDAKVLDPYFAADELDAGFDFGFVGNTLGFLQGRGRAVAYNAYLERQRNPREGYLLAHYLSSHDVPGALYQLGGDKELFRLAAILQLTVAGIPTIFYGEEVGRLGGDWPENRSDMPWGDLEIAPGAGAPRDESMRALYQQLIALRRAHPALSRGTHKGVVHEGDLYAFERVLDGDRVFVAVNRGATAVNLSVPLPSDWTGRQVVDGLTLEPAAIVDGRIEFVVAARGARIVLGR